MAYYDYFTPIIDLLSLLLLIIDYQLFIYYLFIYLFNCFSNAILLMIFLADIEHRRQGWRLSRFYGSRVAARDRDERRKYNVESLQIPGWFHRERPELIPGEYNERCEQNENRTLYL